MMEQIMGFLELKFTNHIFCPTPIRDVLNNSLGLSLGTRCCCIALMANIKRFVDVVVLGGEIIIAYPYIKDGL